MKPLRRLTGLAVLLLGAGGGVLAAQARGVCPHGPSPLLPMRMTAVYEQPFGVLAAAIPRGLAAAGYEVDSSRVGEAPPVGYWRSLPSHAWPAGVNQAALDEEHPGLRAVAELSVRHDSTVVTYTIRLVCAARTPTQNAPGGAANQLQIRAALALASGIARGLPGPHR